MHQSFDRHLLIHEMTTARSPESLVEQLHGEAGFVLLRSSLFDSPQARYSFIAARPFLTFRSFGSRCEVFSVDKPWASHGAHHAPHTADHASRITHHGSRFTRTQFGNPWHVLDSLMSRYELLEEADLPFPLGGCFGY